MRKHIILINGSGGQGKDTFIKYCAGYCKLYNVSTVDKVKEAAIILGWDGVKDEKGRKFLHTLKKLAVENYDYSFKEIDHQVNTFYELKDTPLMFIHSREPEELKLFSKVFKAKSLLVLNNKVEIIKSNPSDANVLDYKYDYIIDNSDTLMELHEKAYDFVKCTLGIPS